MVLQRTARHARRQILDTPGVLLVACAAEVRRVSQASRLRALEAEGLLHPRADAVTAALFAAGRVLPGRGQGAGQVRDAARAPARRGVGDRGRGRARLLPGRVLPGRRGVRAGRDERAARRQTRPPRPGQAHRARSWSSCRPRRRPGPAPSWPRRSPTGSGWCCTGAPWNGPDGGERRLRWSRPVAGSGRSARQRRPTTRRCGRTCWPPARRRTA